MKRVILFICSLALFLSGCAGVTPSPLITVVPTLAPPSVTTIPATATLTTLPPTPTAQSTAAATLIPTATQTTAPTHTVTPTLAPDTPLEGAALIAALQQGGYNIAFRHAITDQRQTDAVPENLRSCIAQRNLNDAGREQARAIGSAFTALRIPVGKVLFSPYCRTRDTATLAFGRAETE